MSFFKKRKKTEVIGKGSDRIITLWKEFEVSNCTPLSYVYTNSYANFLANAENFFKRVVNNTAVDDLNSDMFDTYLDSITDEMKNSAKEQFIYHLQLVNHHRGLVEGEIVKATGHRENLKNDLEEIESQISKYKKHKETLNIH